MLPRPPGSESFPMRSTCIGCVPTAARSCRGAGWRRPSTRRSWSGATWTSCVAPEEQLASVPTWVQNLVLYDLLFYLRSDQRQTARSGLVPLAWTDRFHALAEEVLGYIDVETIDGFSVMPTSRQLSAVADHRLQGRTHGAGQHRAGEDRRGSAIGAAPLLLRRPAARRRALGRRPTGPSRITPSGPVTLRT